MQPEDLADFAFVDGREVEEAGTLILHVNSPLLPLAMLKLGASLVRNKRVIGYWAWELPRVPADWRHGMPFVHEIWVPSGFTADAIRPRAGNRPVRVMGHPIAVRNAPQIQRRRPSNYPFTVLTIFDMGSSFARKNPCAAIQAFRLAFGNDERARLTIKCSNAALFPKGLALMRAAIGKADNIKVIDRIMPPCEVEALYSEADAGAVLDRYADLQFVLIDCEKDDYVRFFDRLRLAPGAVVVADNILSHDLHDYVRHVRAVPGIRSITLPIGKGLEVSRVDVPRTRSAGPA
jgi:hypothetical protein